MQLSCSRSYENTIWYNQNELLLPNHKRNSREKVASLVAAATQVPYIIPGAESVSEALSFGTNLCRPSDSFSRFSSFSGQSFSETWSRIPSSPSSLRRQSRGSRLAGARNHFYECLCPVWCSIGHGLTFARSTMARNRLESLGSKAFSYPRLNNKSITSLKRTKQHQGVRICVFECHVLLIKYSTNVLCADTYMTSGYHYSGSPPRAATLNLSQPMLSAGTK